MTWPWIVLFVSLWVCVIGLGLLVLGLSQRLQQIERAVTVSPLQGGAPPHTNLIGSLLHLPEPHTGLLPAGEGIVLLFLSSRCAPCLRLGRELERELAADEVLREKLCRVRITIISDPAGESLYRPALGVMSLVSEPTGEISRALGVRATPFGIAVTPDRIVRDARVLTDVSDVEGLANESLAPDLTGVDVQ
jgi:thioredoxin-related protein